MDLFCCMALDEGAASKPVGWDYIPPTPGTLHHHPGGEAVFNSVGNLRPEVLPGGGVAYGGGWRCNTLANRRQGSASSHVNCEPSTLSMGICIRTALKRAWNVLSKSRLLYSRTSGYFRIVASSSSSRSLDTDPPTRRDLLANSEVAECFLRGGNAGRPANILSRQTKLLCQTCYRNVVSISGFPVLVECEDPLPGRAAVR